MHNKESIQQKLEALKMKLEKEIDQLEEHAPEFGSDTDHLEEKTSEAEQYSANLGVGETLRARLADVETALEKLAHGTYGICEKCGMAIEPEILAIDPESRYCRECKLAMKK